MKKIIALVFVLFLLVGGFVFSDTYDYLNGVWVEISAFSEPGVEALAVIFYEVSISNRMDLKNVIYDEKSGFQSIGKTFSGEYFISHNNKIVAEYTEVYDANGNFLESTYYKIYYDYKIYQDEGIWYLMLNDGDQTYLYVNLPIS